MVHKQLDCKISIIQFIIVLSIRNSGEGLGCGFFCSFAANQRKMKKTEQLKWGFAHPSGSAAASPTPKPPFPSQWFQWGFLRTVSGRSMIAPTVRISALPTLSCALYRGRSYPFLLLFFLFHPLRSRSRGRRDFLLPAAIIPIRASARAVRSSS